jgi:hypothetical protein
MCLNTWKGASRENMMMEGKQAIHEASNGID